MALKPITLRLDAEEYEKLKENLSKFGDPDINVAYVLRAYIRDLNRVYPALMTSGWDLKNYFGFFGLWLRQVVSMTDVEVLSRKMFDWWTLGNPQEGPSQEGGADERVAGRKKQSTARKERGDDR